MCAQLLQRSLLYALLSAGGGAGFASLSKSVSYDVLPAVVQPDSMSINKPTVAQFSLIQMHHAHWLQTATGVCAQLLRRLVLDAGFAGAIQSGLSFTICLVITSAAAAVTDIACVQLLRRCLIVTTMQRRCLLGLSA